jgi:protein-disulfide isomerase
MIEVRVSRICAALLLTTASLLAGCSPSPDELRAALKKHPEILAEAIREHPTEVMEALQAAADSYQHLSQAKAARAEDERIERELAAPRHPAIGAGRALRGAPGAPVTIVEYSDFQCPYCRRDASVLKAVLTKYPGRVRLVLKQAPLTSHAHAMEAARMFEAVLLQGQEKAWRYHDLLFENQERLTVEGGAYLDAAARSAGADAARARRDAQTVAVSTIVDADLAEFQQFGFSGTPAFIVNGVVLDGAHPIEDFDRVIARVLAGQSPPAGIARPDGGGDSSAAPR